MPLLHILLCSSPLFDVRVHASRRRNSPLVLTHPSLSARSRARLNPSLSFLALTPSRARAQCPVGVHAGHPRRRASIRCAPSRTTSPFASSTRSRARSSQPRAESTFRAPVTAGRHCLATPELRPSIDLRPPVYLRPIQAVVSSAVTSSISPTLFPFGSAAVVTGNMPRRRGRLSAAAVPVAGRLRAGSSCAAARPGVA